MKKRGLLIALALLATLLIGGYFFINAPKAGLKSAKAAYSLTADDLYAEYAADEDAGNKKYIDQVLQVDGPISEILTDENQAMVLILKTPESEGGVMCTLEKEADLSVGDEVSVKGRCTGMLIDVVLNDGVVMK